MTMGAIFFLPETPSCLIKQGSNEKARKVLEKIRGTEHVDAEFQHMVAASEIAANETKHQHPIKVIFYRRSRPQLVMAIFVPIFQNLTGINCILFYAPVMFLSLGFRENDSLYSSAITGAVLVLSTLIHGS